MAPKCHVLSVVIEIDFKPKAGGTIMRPLRFGLDRCFVRVGSRVVFSVPTERR
jgi:hypothetical protein